MAQCKLSSYYTTRKRKTDTKLLNNDLKTISQESLPNIVKLIQTQDIKVASQQPVLLRKSKVTSESSNIQTQIPEESEAKSKAASTKSKIPRAKSTRAKAKKQTKATDNAKNIDIRKSFNAKVNDISESSTVECSVPETSQVENNISETSKVESRAPEISKIENDDADNIKINSNDAKSSKVNSADIEKIKIDRAPANTKVKHKAVEKAKVKNKAVRKVKVGNEVTEKKIGNKVVELTKVGNKTIKNTKIIHTITEEDKVDDKVANENETLLNSTYTIISETPQKSEELLVRSPKRNLSNPDEANADSKKKKRQDIDELNSSTFADNEAIKTPNKHSELMIKHSARKNLFIDYRSDSLAKKNSKDLEVSAAVSVNHKSPPISSEKLSQLKEKLARFDQTYKKFQDFKSNKCKITSVISSEANKKPDAADTEEKPVPCCIKYHSAVAPLATLVLPYAYKLLSESFRCSDTVVSMLNNRKEVCTFEKLKNGVQDMTKRNFSRVNLGQIKTVFPLAYNYHVEKNSVSVMNRKPGTLPYELVISPNLTMYKSEIKDSTTPKPSSGSFQAMTPACLIERKNIFVSNLVNIVKKHHQSFLMKLNPPVFVPMDKLTKWHPKFPVDGLPEVEASELPEPPNKLKANTAMDVLNKIRGSAGERIEKALQSVAEKNLEQEKKKNMPGTKTTVTNRLLKNISADLLERIRARESARIVEDITKDPKDKKRKEMMERVPELIRILRTYFITERRAAISLEDATQKIMDSYHSILNAEDIRQHLQLIADIFPKWLSLIPIRKGLFLKIDKNKDINVLLDNMPAV